MKFTVRNIRMKRVSGEADYHMTIVSNEFNGHALLVKRWGKVGTAGQVRVKRLVSKAGAQALANKTINEKTKANATHTYDVTENKDYSELDLSATFRNVPAFVKREIEKEIDGVNKAWLGMDQDSIAKAEQANLEAEQANLEAEQAELESIGLNDISQSTDHYGTW